MVTMTTPPAIYSPAPSPSPAAAFHADYSAVRNIGLVDRCAKTAPIVAGAVQAVDYANTIRARDAFDGQAPPAGYHWNPNRHWVERWLPTSLFAGPRHDSALGIAFGMAIWDEAVMLATRHSAAARCGAALFQIETNASAIIYTNQHR